MEAVNSLRPRFYDPVREPSQQLQTSITNPQQQTPTTGFQEQTPATSVQQQNLATSVQESDGQTVGAGVPSSSNDAQEEDGRTSNSDYSGWSPMNKGKGRQL